MKVINYLTEENDKLYDVNTMVIILGTTKSKIQREIKRQNVSPLVKYKNQYLYPENTLFRIMESILYKKWKRNYGH
jgi:hypothetical protein